MYIDFLYKGAKLSPSSSLLSPFRKYATLRKMDTKVKDSSLTFALQALLARHEAYMADAERDRLELTARIERLELDKQELEAENASKIEENRNLLDQLELLNNTVSESDTKIRSLEASLLSSQQAIRRLEGAVARAEDAERHLAALEEEQDKLHSELRNTKEDSRSHAQRWKEAQRGILDMQDQLERMETEARVERERHAEVIGRMEKQREMEKQLDTAAGRLKGAAAATKSLSHQQKPGNSVVSHFVRDLLQDNANLQLGIAELREMLMNSNDEIQSLREQLMFHQPMQQEEQQSRPQNTSLQEELGPQQDQEEEGESPNPARLSQELHIHHHYHVTPKQGKPRKKRLGLMPGVFNPPPTASHPAVANMNSQWGITSSPSTPALSQYERARHTSSPLAHRNSWGSNAPSEFTSSVPSSPRSNRVSSVFDSSVFDGNPPTSPTTSFDPMSPTWRAHRKRTSAASFQSFHAIPPLDTLPEQNPSAMVQGVGMSYFDDTIHEEDEETHREDVPGLEVHETSTEHSTTEDSEASRDDYMPRPRLRRAQSHESIMSLSGGLDIHTLKARPSQMTLRPLGGLEAVVTGVIAQPTLSTSTAKRSDVTLRDHFASYQSIRSVSGSGLDTPRSASPASQSTARSSTSGGGRWWRPWGGGAGLTPATATKSVTPVTTPATTTTTTSPTPTPGPDKNKGKAKAGPSNRAPGINQAGAIPGFQEYWASQKRRGAPAIVHAQSVDRDALSDGLQE